MISKLIFNLCAVAALLLATAGQAAEVELDRMVAIVNDEAIMHSELRQEMRTVEESLGKQGTRLPPRNVLEKQVLDRLILQRLQLQLASRAGLRVDDNQLNDALRDMARQNNLTLEQLRLEAEKDGFSFASFREMIRNQLLLQRVQQRQVASRVNVSEAEINDFLATQSQQNSGGLEHRLLHILIALPEGASPEIIQEKQKKSEEVMEKLRGGADFQETAVAVSESRQALEGGDLGWRKAGEIPSLFAAEVATMKPNDVRGPLRNASGFHIIKLAGSRGGSQVTVTQTHARHILIKTSETLPETEARNKLQQIRTRLENGEDFATLARANSEDPGSASQGGDLGWVNPGAMVDEFEEAMDKLAVNEISQPFKTTYGWHVVQIVGRRQHDNTSEALRNRAAKQIRQRKIEEELQSWLRQLREESYVEYRLDEG